MPASAEPLDVVKAFMAAFERLDYDAAVTHIAEDCTYRNMPEGMPVMTGPAGVRAMLEPFFAPVARNEFVILREASAGPVVFLERLDRHFLKNGSIVELPVTGIFEVHDGKITIWNDYFDAATITSKWPSA
jgi:limonene-1,2-epoxide hydrolase